MSMKRYVTFLLITTCSFAYGGVGQEREVLKFAKKDPADLVNTFYPVARFICNRILPRLSSKQVDEFFEVLVPVCDRKTWFYFCDSPKKFRGEYLEKILVELAEYADFLSKPSEDDDNDNRKQQSMRACAIYCDFLVVKFNSYAMRSNVTSADAQQARAVLDLLSQAIGFLTGSQYENQYKRALERAYGIKEGIDKRVSGKQEQVGGLL